MLPVSVPQSQKRPLTELARLGASEFRDLLALINEAPAATSPYELWKRLERKGITEIQRSILIAVFNLRTLLEAQRFGAEELIKAVARDVVAKTWLTEDAEIQAFRERVPQLLNVPAVALTEKAFNLTSSSPRAIDSSKVLTDVRPLFSGGRSDLKAQAVVIMHTLRMVLRDGDDQYVSMTSKELQELQATLSRAAQKEEQIRSQIVPTGLIFVDDDPVAEEE